MHLLREVLTLAERLVLHPQLFKQGKEKGKGRAIQANLRPYSTVLCMTKATLNPTLHKPIQMRVHQNQFTWIIQSLPYQISNTQYVGPCPTTNVKKVFSMVVSSGGVLLLKNFSINHV